MTSRTRADNDKSPAHANSLYDKQPRDLVQRKASEQNQVLPFYLDGDDDDNDDNDDNDIRRRRYSSSSSSSASSDADKHRPEGRKKPQLRASRERENDWERASSHAASSCDGDAQRDSDPNDRDSSHSYNKNAGDRRGREEPESPRRQHGRTQQSDASADESHQEDEEQKSCKMTTKSTAAVVSTPLSTAPSARLATNAMPVDLSRISKLAVFPGSESQLIQGHVVRVKTLLQSHYHFFIKDQLILLAEKQLKNRTSNYHIFDMTRTTALSSKLSKKSGNYLGKLRSNFSKKKNVLFGNLSRKTELGAVVFADHTSSNEPRHLNVILPALAPKRQEIEGLAVGDNSTAFSLLIDVFKHERASQSLGRSSSALQVFENKEPVFDNGYYRLNFNGRVSVPSVKNFQLADGQDDVCLQFGKVDEKKFHLDFRAPLTPIQAFAIALAQFNL